MKKINIEKQDSVKLYKIRKTLQELTKISGRGTAQTKDQELAFLLTLSAIHAGANPKEKEDFLSMMLNPSIYKEVYDGCGYSRSEGGQ